MPLWSRRSRGCGRPSRVVNHARSAALAAEEASCSPCSSKAPFRFPLYSADDHSGPLSVIDRKTSPPCETLTVPLNAQGVRQTHTSPAWFSGKRKAANSHSLVVVGLWKSGSVALNARCATGKLAPPAPLFRDPTAPVPVGRIVPPARSAVSALLFSAVLQQPLIELPGCCRSQSMNRALPRDKPLTLPPAHRSS